MKMLKSVTKIVPVFQMMVYILVIFALSSWYMMVLTKSLPISASIGFITSVVAFYFAVYIPRKVKRQQYLYKELQKYTTNMAFYLQTGNNVLKSLQLSKKNLDKEIQKDIDKTIKILQDEARLEVDHFKKYGFHSLNIFHQILKIKYDVGGNAKDLFMKVNQSINFEIVKRDELYRRKNYLMKKAYAMVMMTLSIPLILAYAAKDLFSTFLSMGMLSIGVNVLLFMLILINLVFLHRTSSDISLL